jgi:O-acetyl-ADP-ribose deacetylase (regulator of RNase III)
MPCKATRNDIPRLRTGAMVNAAKARPQMGGGVCWAIFGGRA